MHIAVNAHGYYGRVNRGTPLQLPRRHEISSAAYDSHHGCDPAEQHALSEPNDSMHPSPVHAHDTSGSQRDRRSDQPLVVTMLGEDKHLGVCRRHHKNGSVDRHYNQGLERDDPRSNKRGGKYTQMLSTRTSAGKDGRAQVADVAGNAGRNRRGDVPAGRLRQGCTGLATQQSWRSDTL